MAIDVVKNAKSLEITISNLSITDEQWEIFQRNGYLQLGRVLTDAQVEELKQRADDLAMGAVKNDRIQLQLDTGGGYDELAPIVDEFVTGTIEYRKIQGLEWDDKFRPLVENPIFLDACRRSYGNHAPLSLFRAMVMNKPAKKGTYLPWHQDAGRVWRLDRDPVVTVWVAIDSATVENGCVEIIPGSHRNGLLTVEGSTLTETQAEQYCPTDQAMALEVPAGHAYLMHNWVFHRSGVNRSTRPRRAFTASFMDGRTVNTLTGDRFPAIFEDSQPSPDEYQFLTTFHSVREHLQESIAEATRYIRSLEAECDKLRMETARPDAAPAPTAEVSKQQRTSPARSRQQVRRRAYVTLEVGVSDTVHFSKIAQKLRRLTRLR